MARLIVTSTDDNIYPPIVRVRLTRPFILIAMYIIPPPYTVSFKKVKDSHPSAYEMRIRFDLPKPIVLTLTVPETFLNAAKAIGRFMIMNGEFRVHVFMPKQPVTQRVAKTSRQVARGAR